MFERVFYVLGEHSIIHSIPYLSLNIPAYVPHGLSPIGPSIFPPAERPLNNLFASSLLSVLIEILLLFSFSFTFPINSGTSFAINTLPVSIGKAIYIILCSSFSDTEKEEKEEHKIMYIALPIDTGNVL